MTSRTASIVLALIAGAGCASRSDVWDRPPSTTPQAFGLTSSVIVLDDPEHRALALTATGDQRLDVLPLPVGHHVVGAKASPDLTRLFVLAAGDVPRRSDKDEKPSLTVVDGSTSAPTAARYAMAEPLSGLAIDPAGRYAAAFAGPGGQTSFVENPNEIVLFDLTQPPGDRNPTSRTIQSFGGRPQRLTFTPVLELPGGPRRLLVIETQQDVTLVDLDHSFDSPPRPEITVRLTDGATARQIVPAGVVVDDGDPARADDARVAVRSTNDTNVITLQLAPPSGSSQNDFEPKINLTDVLGVPSDIAFVRTDGGLRVAALVPSKSNAVLVDPDTSVTTAVALPSPYQRLSLVTDVVGSNGGAPGTDVALLWSAGAASSGVAFWTLGKTAGTPYRSVEVLGLDEAIQEVLDVPPPRVELKLLQTQTQTGFYVLDLRARTASPLTTSGGATLVTAPDGGRFWAFQQGTSQLASIDLAALHPVPLYVDRPIFGVYDVARADGGRALVALHARGTLGATVFDALTPDTATARLYSALLLEGL